MKERVQNSDVFTKRFSYLYSYNHNIFTESEI